MIPIETIDRIRDIDIVSVIEREGVALKRSGSSYQCCCPFHQEKTPSFVVTPSRNTAHCFGSCGRTFDSISFVMEKRGLTFYEAAKHLAKEYSIPIDEREESPEDRQARFRKETLMAVNKAALDWFRCRFRSAPAAQDYCKKRGWNEDSVETFEIGYAPKGGGLLDELLKQGHKTADLLEAGVIKQNPDTGVYYDTFRDRLIFPLYTTSGILCGFTGRYMGDIDNVAKYLNTADTPLFSKSKTLFGWRVASRQIGASRAVVLCEGNPDVVRLHQIGVLNAIAPCGTALTDEQIDTIARKAKSVIYIGDMDAAGEKAVIKNAPRLIEKGLDVRVMRWDPQLGKDPDEYFGNRPRGYSDALAQYTNDFLPWYHALRMKSAGGLAEVTDIITELSGILASMKDQEAAGVLLDTFRKRDGKYTKIWTSQFYKARNESERKSTVKDESAQEMLRNYGFYVKNNCYFGAGANSGDKLWSNFTMRPVLHIRNESNAKRVFELVNDRHEEAVVKLSQSEMVSLSDFKTRTESAGNFVWEATAAELTRLKRYLYDNTPSADEIRQLGWQKRHGFWAWGNGGMDEDGKFYQADKYGIVEIGDRKYYLPGCAADTQANTQGFLTERQFVYLETNKISLRDYVQRLVAAFGDNARVAVCYLLATMFRDIVIQSTNGDFPLLCLFGPKGTGKSKLGTSLSSFFFTSGRRAPNVSNATKAALAEAVAEVSNAIVHLDEMKKDIDVEKYEFLKGIYDGSGRTRLNVDNEKKREMTAVDCGVVLSGQEMPTADIALFSRTIYLTFAKTSFTDEEKRIFDDLKVVEARGLTHLTKEILQHRSRFRSGFRVAFDDTRQDLNTLVRSYGMEDRTLNNWTVILAAFRTLESWLDLPFKYGELLKTFAELCVRQNSTTKENSELSEFWDGVETLVSGSKIWIEADYRIIEGGRTLRPKNGGPEIQTNASHRYLLFNYKRVFSLYMLENRQTGNKVIPKDSLKFYIEHTPEYLGLVGGIKFKKLISSAAGVDQNHSTTTTAMVFDYDALCHNYGINLDILQSGSIDDAEEVPEAPDVPVLPPAAPGMFDDLPE